MTFDAREATRAAAANYPPFDFIGLDGCTYQLPHPLMVDPASARRAQSGEISADELIRLIAPEAADAIDQMKPGVQRELMLAWRAEMDPQLEELGKELGQSSETPGSVAPLKPISRPVASTSGNGHSGSSAARPKRS